MLKVPISCSNCTATKNRMVHFWEADTAAPISGLIGAKVKATDMLSGYTKGGIVIAKKICW